MTARHRIAPALRRAGGLVLGLAALLGAARPASAAASATSSVSSGSLHFNLPTAGAKDLGLTVTAGAVTLTGAVQSLEAERKLLDATMAVPNVRNVVDHLVVDPAHRPDAAIRADVQSALERDPSVGTDSVQVEVNAGTVTLKGTLKEWQERDLAGWIAGKVPGVRAVSNEIGLLPMGRPDDEIRQQIVDDLVVGLSSVRVPAEPSNSPAGHSEDRLVAVTPPAVAVSDGAVVLTGSLPTLLARKQAEEIAESVIGVKSVEDDVTLQTNPRVSDGDIARAVRDALAKLGEDEQNASLYSLD